MKNKSIEFDNIEEILSNVPSWLTLWSKLVILIIFISILIFLHLISFSNEETVKVEINKKNNEELYETNLIGKFKINSIKPEDLDQKQVFYVEISGYPYQDYGMLKGCFLRKSSKKNEIFIYFPEGNNTTKNKKILVLKNQLGKARIFSKKESYTRRIYNKYIK